MKNILIFGAGDNQIWLIKSCKEIELYTHVVDIHEEAPGKKFADEFHVLAANDFEAHKALIIEKNIEGIVTCQMENPLYLMADLASYFGFNFPSKESIQKARDKFLMKQAFIEHKVACAKGKILQSDDKFDFNSVKKYFGIPFIIKPLDSFSSKGVYSIINEKDFNEFIPKTFSFSKSGKILIEEFLEGPEVSVEGVVYNNELFVIQITDKIISDYPYTVELGHIQPSQHPINIQNQIKKLVKSAITALGLNHTGFHAEVKITSQGPKMIEIGARLGGDYISSYLTYNSCGVDLNKAVAQIALNIAPNLKKGALRYAMVGYYNWDSGKIVDSVRSLKSVESIKGVIKVHLFVKQDEQLPEITDSAKRHSVYIISANSRDDLTKLDSKVKNIMKNIIVTK